MMKRDVPSVYFGIIVGLSLGFVLCNVVHAETTCPTTLDAEAERCRDEAYRDMLSRAFGSLRPNPISAYESDLLNCYVQMEAAMRAMDEFIDPKPISNGSYDGCNYCDSWSCTLLACPFGGNEVARLEWELKQAKKKEEAAKQRAVALTQWEQAKACWRKP